MSFWLPVYTTLGAISPVIVNVNGRIDLYDAAGTAHEVANVPDAAPSTLPTPGLFPLYKSELDTFGNPELIFIGYRGTSGITAGQVDPIPFPSGPITVGQLVGQEAGQGAAGQVVVVPPPPDKNVVFFLLDDGGAEWFNWSGLLAPVSGYPLTPRMDEMRTHGVTFLKAYATPICGPTRARLHTGRYAFHSSLGGNLDGPGSQGYRFGIHGGVQTETLLAGAVRFGFDGSDDTNVPLINFRYASGWFGKCHVCSDAGEEKWPVDVAKVGRYVGCQPQDQSMVHWPAGQFAPTPLALDDANSGHFHFRETTVSPGLAAPGYTSTMYGNAGTWPAGGPYVAWDPTAVPNKGAFSPVKVCRDFVSWANTRTQPFLAFVNMNPPHAVFEVPPYTYPDTIGVGATAATLPLISAGTQAAMTALDGGGKGPGYIPPSSAFPDASTIAVFKANVESYDTLIGMVWDRMDPAIRANTVFILAGDNGTVSDAVDAPYDPNGTKRTVYEMGSRVPMIVFGGTASGIVSPGRTTDHLTHVVDFFPTALDIMGCDPVAANPLEKTIDGVSFKSLLTNAGAAPHRTFIYEEIFTPLDAELNGTDGAPDINATQWIKAYHDGAYKIIEKPQGAPAPPYQMFKITDEAQPATGQPGYLELHPASGPTDDLYAFSQDGLHHQITVHFNDLVTAMAALLAT